MSRPFAGLVGALALVVALGEARDPAWRVLDPVAAPTAAVVATILSLAGEAVVREGRVLAHRGGFAYEIGGRCAGLLPVAVFVVLVLGDDRRSEGRLRAVLAGGAALLVLNLVRLVHLYRVGVAAPASFARLHDVVWPWAILSATFLSWWSWRTGVLRRIATAPACRRGARAALAILALALPIGTLRAAAKAQESAAAMDRDEAYRRALQAYDRLAATLAQQPDNRAAHRRNVAALRARIDELARAAAAPEESVEEERPSPPAEPAAREAAPATLGPPSGPYRPSAAPSSEEERRVRETATERGHPTGGPLEGPRPSLEGVAPESVRADCRRALEHVAALERALAAEPVDEEAIAAAVEALGALLRGMGRPADDARR